MVYVVSRGQALCVFMVGRVLQAIDSGTLTCIKEEKNDFKVDLPWRRNVAYLGGKVILAFFTP